VEDSNPCYLLFQRPHTLWVVENITLVDPALDTLQSIYILAPIRRCTAVTQCRIDVAGIRSELVVWLCELDDLVEAGKEVVSLIFDLIKGLVRVERFLPKKWVSTDLAQWVNSI